MKSVKAKLPDSCRCSGNCCNVLLRKDKPRISVINLAEEHREFGARHATYGKRIPHGSHQTSQHRQKVRCPMVKPALHAAAFVERLPRRPYCTDDPAQGLLIRPQATALAYRHIQHNPPPHVPVWSLTWTAQMAMRRGRMPDYLPRTGSRSTPVTAMLTMGTIWRLLWPVPVRPSKDRCAIWRP